MFMLVSMEMLVLQALLKFNLKRDLDFKGETVSKDELHKETSEQAET